MVSTLACTTDIASKNSRINDVVDNKENPSTNTTNNLKNRLPKSNTIKQDEIPINQRTVSNTDINNDFIKLLNYSSNEIIKNSNNNSITTANFKIEDLTNFLMLENGVLAKLAKDKNNHELLFNLFEARVENSIADLKNNSKIKASKANKLINNLSNALIAFKGNHNNASTLIAIMNEYDKSTNNIGINVKITALLMRALGCESANSINIDLSAIDKKDINDNLLKKLDTFYKKQTSKSHNNTITEAINNNDLPNIPSSKKQDILGTFIAEKPDMIADLIANNASEYVAKYTDLEQILNHKCDNKLTQLTNKVKNLEKTPESITNFLKSLPRNQKDSIEKKLTSDIANIYASIVENQLQIEMPKNEILNQAESYKKCENAINLLKNTDAVANADLIVRLTKNQTNVKATIIESFIKMQAQLKLPEYGKKDDGKQKKDDKQIKKMLLLKNLSHQDILASLNSTNEGDEHLKTLFDHIANYITAMSDYSKENTVNTRIVLHQTRFDMLKSQQTYIEKETGKFLQKNKYKSKPLNTSDFNTCLKKVALAYDIRKNNHANFRAVKTLRISDLVSAALVPSIEYETKKEDLLGSLLNKKIKKEVGYSFFSHLKTVLKSMFSKGKKKSLLRQKIDAERAKDPNIQGVDSYKLKEGWKISNLFAGIRSYMHYELKYMLELSKNNPYLFKQIAKDLAGSIPLILATFKGDETIATLIKDINKKIGDEKFVGSQVGEKPDNVPEFNKEILSDPQLAEAMRSLYFIKDLTNFTDTYILTTLSIIVMYIPEKTVAKFVDKAFKNMLKKGEVHFVTDFVFYIIACIKQNRPVEFTPGENILKRISFKWITSYIKGFKRISNAVKDVIAKKPNAIKKLFYEIYRFFRTLAITVFVTSLVVVPLIFIFELALISALLIGLAVAIPILNEAAKDEYGITSDNLSLASFFKNQYLSNMVVKDNYDNPKVKQRFQDEYDMLVNYNDTGNCIKKQLENNNESKENIENTAKKAVDNDTINSATIDDKNKKMLKTCTPHKQII